MKKVPPPNTTQRARNLRKDMTDAERAMWRLLKEAFAEQRFRRQVPMRHYIVDFASHRAKLIIEVDGGQHNEAVDAPRTAILEAEGYKVIRFWNDDVLRNADGVGQMIAQALSEGPPPPNPPPSRGRAIEVQIL